MNFGQALEAIKTGEAVAREGWNGKNMYIYLEEGFKTVSLIKNTQEEENISEQDYEPCIVMKTAQGKLQPGWLASQNDMLAEDWIVIEDAV